MIKIKKEENNITLIKDLVIGDTFICDDEYFITTNLFNGSSVRCVNLKRGEVVTFTFTTEVEKINFKLTVEEK